MQFKGAPSNKKVTCKICYICDNTGFDYPSDLDSDYHEGFTIGRGKQMYWMMTWHKSGHVTVYSNDPNGSNKPLRRRWLDGDTMITIHFK